MEWGCLRASNPFLQTHFVEAIEVRFQIPEFHPKNYIDNSKRYSKWYLWRLKSRQTFQQLVLKRDMYSSFFVKVLKIFQSHIVLCTKFTHDIWENIFRLFCFLPNFERPPWLHDAKGTTMELKMGWNPKRKIWEEKNFVLSGFVCLMVARVLKNSGRLHYNYHEPVFEINMSQKNV